MVGGTLSSIVGSITSGATVTSPQAGNITMSTANRTMWGHMDMREGTNKSMNINDWSQVELQNFVKWFIEVNYPDAVKEYQAVRDIERQIEEANRMEEEIARAELMKQYWANQAKGAQNAYPFPLTSQQGYGIAVSTDPPKKSFLRKLGDWIDGV